VDVGIAGNDFAQRQAGFVLVRKKNAPLHDAASQKEIGTQGIRCQR
jgi:hypothetical protein